MTGTETVQFDKQNDKNGHKLNEIQSTYSDIDMKWKKQKRMQKPIDFRRTVQKSIAVGANSVNGRNIK